MDWAGWAVFGFAATLALTAIMVGAQMAGRTRMSIPLLLGTMFTPDLERARFAGFLFHLANGQFFALFYAAAFALLDESSWWLGGLFGAFHGVVALLVIVPTFLEINPRVASDRSGPELTTTLEPPGLLALHYGVETPVVTMAAHIVYGAILGAFLTSG
ncbi:MAG TPA: hypothetical protein VFO84_06485 [Dehalococcoidia bacterium]|nr:hypothetical protein [Dehalococcoidia bacterium]